jgi:hypothetical protein
MEYLDFELEISPHGESEFLVSVIRSPAGEVAQSFARLPFSDAALKLYLKDLQIAILRSGGLWRGLGCREEVSVQEFGGRLFDTFFDGEVRSCYDASQRLAAQQGKGLRLKLRIKSPRLAALPWEFLYDSREGDFICLSREKPLVRYLDLSRPVQPLAVSPPLRVLGVLASPRDLDPLNVRREKQRVEEAVRSLQEDGLLELTWLEGQTWRDLQHAMRGSRWHVLHFIGHGGFDRHRDEGFIALSDENGETYRLSAAQLARLMADHRSLRLVLLNSCEGARGSERDIFSSTAAVLIRRGVPAVLAMQYEITDLAAVEFSRSFFDCLVDGQPVDTAVAEARKSLSMAIPNTVEWGTPVLYMRSADGQVFDIKRKGGRRGRPKRQLAPLTSQQQELHGGVQPLPLEEQAGTKVALNTAVPIIETQPFSLATFGRQALRKLLSPGERLLTVTLAMVLLGVSIAFWWRSKAEISPSDQTQKEGKGDEIFNPPVTSLTVRYPFTSVPRVSGDNPADFEEKIRKEKIRECEEVLATRPVESYEHVKALRDLALLWLEYRHLRAITSAEGAYQALKKRGADEYAHEVYGEIQRVKAGMKR